MHRHIRPMKLLLTDKRVNPLDRSEVAVRRAINLGHHDVSQFLRSLADIRPRIEARPAFENDWDDESVGSASILSPGAISDASIESNEFEQWDDYSE